MARHSKDHNTSSHAILKKCYAYDSHNRFNRTIYIMGSGLWPGMKQVTFLNLNGLRPYLSVHNITQQQFCHKNLLGHISTSQCVKPTLVCRARVTNKEEIHNFSTLCTHITNSTLSVWAKGPLTEQRPTHENGCKTQLLNITPFCTEK